ncbi:hypothetical protein VNO78_22494 [Psophocarpus tetragonolobus]|uniref:Uncharacterized protein n=1 Tax=Psophocarpus tetragonolobus TaxID=3891 RepID=A0AAN9XDI1_PSOTE
MSMPVIANRDSLKPQRKKLKLINLPNILLKVDMQTKKKTSRRNVSQECNSPKVSRAQRKVSKNARAAEKRVTDLITSSAKKNKSFSTLENKAREPILSTDLNNGYEFMDSGTSTTSIDDAEELQIGVMDFL